jgi:hypothetical protein
VGQRAAEAAAALEQQRLEQKRKDAQVGPQTPETFLHACCVTAVRDYTQQAYQLEGTRCLDSFQAINLRTLLSTSSTCQWLCLLNCSAAAAAYLSSWSLSRADSDWWDVDRAIQWGMC